MAAKKCVAGHKGCSCGMMCCSVTDERAAEIRASARSGSNWAEREAASSNSPSGSFGPGCICGAGERTYTASVAFKGKYGQPDEKCYRHPGGTVYARREGHGTEEDGREASR